MFQSLTEKLSEAFKHFKNKGKFEDFAPFIEKVVNSDFFQNLS